MPKQLTPWLALAAFTMLAGSAAHAEDPAARWTGAYVGGDLGGAMGGSSTGYTATSPCHVGCQGGGAALDGHAGYGSELGHGFTGGAEGSLGR